MSSSGLIYAVIVGAWAAYLVPMWLRRQDELNEARPTERFSTAIRLLSGRAGMERRYAKDLRARSAEDGEQDAHDPDAVTDSVDVRAFAVSQTRRETRASVPQPEPGPEPAADGTRERTARGVPAAEAPRPRVPAARHGSAAERAERAEQAERVERAERAERAAQRAQNARAAQAAAARARRSKVLARRRRTTTMLFLAFTLGAIVAAVGGLAFLWAPGVPAVLLSAYIAYLRSQERRRFAYQMDRRQAEAAARRLRDRSRQPRRRAAVDEADPDEPEGPASGSHPAPDPDPDLSALAAGRRALVEQTDHAEWVDQQRERQRRPGQGGDSWDPVPVPLPTYVTAPVAPRATSDVDLGAPDTWSSARSSAVAPEEAPASAEPSRPDPADTDDQPDDGARSDVRRAASARRARERGRTPLFDQYEDGEHRRAANE
ncbi:gephyrin-like molybdotransferase receptor GlpR [Streptomyces sp. NPDC052013]|uniref:divisome protein SepX/GlpR n=1 Tax=Streptomyces sp. NPDC052013 TaxID=3365679 RepID=UPI0037D474ED